MRRILAIVLGAVPVRRSVRARPASRDLPFASVGRSGGGGHAARDLETLLENEWTVERLRDGRERSTR